MEPQKTSNTDDPKKIPPGQDPKKVEDPKPGGQEPPAKTEGDDGGDPGELDYSDPKATKAAIEALRKENAASRKAKKDLESKFNGVNERFSKLEKGLKGLFGEGDDDIPPEERVSKLSQANQELEGRTALLELAYENDIPKDSVKYFSFLVSEAVDGLKEGEELSEDALAEIVKDVRAKAASPRTSVGGKGDGTGNPPPAKDPSSGDDMTVEQFVKLNMGEKTKLFRDNKDLYTRLMVQAKEQRKI